MSNKLFVKKLVERFEFEILGGAEHLQNEIKVYGLNRAGLELAGYFETGDKARRLILMSTKESTYIKNFNESERRERYKNLMDSGIPGIVLTKKFKDDVVIEVAKECGTPIFRSQRDSTSELSQEILDFMDEYFAPQTEIHGSLVNIFGKGTLIIGESGIGKSEITMDLLKSNHLFVGDDRIVATKKANKIFGKSHDILKNLVEVRGVGIINVAQTHGYQLIMNETPIDLVVELKIFKADGVDDSDRLGNQFDQYSILGSKIPHIKIPVSSGRNISNIVETAIAKLKISESGEYSNPIDLISERIAKIEK